MAVLYSGSIGSTIKKNEMKRKYRHLSKHTHTPLHVNIDLKFTIVQNNVNNITRITIDTNTHN